MTKFSVIPAVVGGDPSEEKRAWIPASVGLTGRERGMMEKELGMTKREPGIAEKTGHCQKALRNAERGERKKILKLKKWKDAFRPKLSRDRE